MEYNETNMVEMMTEAVFEYDAENDEENFADVSSFRDAGVMTTNNGFVMTMTDGSEFQVTVVRSN